MACNRALIRRLKQRAAACGFELWHDPWAQHWVLTDPRTTCSVDAGFALREGDDIEFAIELLLNDIHDFALTEMSFPSADARLRFVCMGVI